MAGHEDEVRAALEAMAQPRLREALEGMGEDPAAVELYLRSELADMRRKGLDRVREAEARLRRAWLRERAERAAQAAGRRELSDRDRRRLN